MSSNPSNSTQTGDRPERTSRTVRRRQRPSLPAPLQLSIPFVIPLHVRAEIPRDWLVRASTRALLMHILYARGLVPTSTTELLRVYRESLETALKKRRPNPMERKFTYCATSLHRLIEEWNLFCSPDMLCGDISHVLLTLGPSWSRPKEQYLLKFSDIEEDDSVKPCPDGAQEHTLSRRLVGSLLRATTVVGLDEEHLVGHPLAYPSSSASSYQAHISIWISTKTVEQIFREISDRDNDCDLSPWHRLWHRVIVRHSYSVTHTGSKQTQPHIITLNVTSSNGHKGSESTWNEQSGVWMSLPTCLKGFRM